MPEIAETGFMMPDFRKGQWTVYDARFAERPQPGEPSMLNAPRAEKFAGLPCFGERLIARLPEGPQKFPGPCEAIRKRPGFSDRMRSRGQNENADICNRHIFAPGPSITPSAAYAHGANNIVRRLCQGAGITASIMPGRENRAVRYARGGRPYFLPRDGVRRKIPQTFLKRFASEILQKLNAKRSG